MTDMDKVIEEAKAAVLPFESWERLPGESGGAYSAFCVYRDYGPERNIRRAVDATEQDEMKRGKRYRVWRNWSTAFKWRERATDYDSYLEKLKQAELRKTIEARGAAHREVTGKMLMVISKKLDLMEPQELTQGAVVDWVQTAINTERTILGVTVPAESKDKQNGKGGNITFTPDFEGL